MKIFHMVVGIRAPIRGFVRGRNFYDNFPYSTLRWVTPLRPCFASTVATSKTATTPDRSIDTERPEIGRSKLPHRTYRAHDERIRRMKDSQIRNLEASLQAKLAELDNSQEVSASYTLIGMGRVEVVAAEQAAA